MQKSDLLKELYAELQKEMALNAGISSILLHVTDMGDNTEESWRSWFNKYLPRRYKAAKATIVDCYGAVSDQIDIVLYDAQYSYLALNKNGILYVPAESVYAVFEVKPALSKRHMVYAGEKAESVRKLHRTSAPIVYAGGVYNPKIPQRILAGILSTNSEWASPYGEPFKACLTNYSELQQVDCGCVLNKGSFFYDYKDSVLSTSAPNESLVYFFFKLLEELQKLGTVPAIEFDKYERNLNITEERIGEQ